MSKKIEELLREYPIREEVKVQWGEMDAFQHVNATVYLRWAESARVNFFQGMPKTTLSIEGQGIGPILGYIQCKYIFPVTFPDTVIIGTHISEFKSDRIKMDHLMVSSTHLRAAALIESWIVTYDYQTLAKTNLPDGLETAIRHYELSHAAG